MNIWLRNTHSSQLHLHFSHIAMQCRATKTILTLDGEEGHYDLDFGDDDNKEKVLLLSRERESSKCPTGSGQRGIRGIEPTRLKGAMSGIT